MALHFDTMLGQPADPLGAIAAYAEVRQDYDWFSDPANATLICPSDPASAGPPSSIPLPPTAHATVTSDKLFRETHYADLTNARTAASLRDPTHPHLSQLDHARLLSCSGKLAHEWLSNPPRTVRTPHHIAPMPGSFFRTALQVRLGLSLSVDRRGRCMCACDKNRLSARHSLGCAIHGWLSRRHEALISVLVALASAAGLKASRTSLKHVYPARNLALMPPNSKDGAHCIPDILIENYPFPGHTTAGDVTVVNPTGTAAQAARFREAANNAHDEKQRHLDDHLTATLAESGEGGPPNTHFAPLAVESYGAVTTTTYNLIDGLCKTHAEMYGCSQSDDAIFRHAWRHRFSTALQLANAKMIHHLAADAPDRREGRKYGAGGRR